jgi:hypothetical protein
MVRTTTSPEADLQFDAVRMSHLLSVAPYRGLHVEGSVAGPHRMVLVG